MKKKLIIILVVLAIAALLLGLALRLLWHFSVNIIPPIPAAVPGTIRVACVGDSTTYGMLLWRREKSNYPAKLGALLGGDYSVRNFAANSTTVLTTGDHPYVDHKVFRLGCDFEPDVVLIMLGTNDAKPENWTGGEAFRADFEALVASYQALASAPDIWLLTPPAVVEQNGKAAYDIDLAALDEICQIEREVAAREGLGLIDIQAATAGRDDLLSGIDGAHPNGKGAAFIARQVYAEAFGSPPVGA